MTRRELARLGISAGVAGAALEAAVGIAEADSTAAPLTSIVMVELLAVFAYEHMLAAGPLNAAGEQLARQFLGHEQRHVTALTDALRKRGEAPPAGPTGVEQANDELSARGGSGSFSDLHSGDDCLRLLVDVEQVVAGAYFVALSELGDPTLLRTGAEIMAAEAQHTTLLNDLLHHGDIKQSVPGAFVEGKH
jgi:hypothetical protein